MKKILLSLAAVGLLFGANSCKDDIDIFAEGEDVTLVYGLLDISDSVQSIKINKVFQGQGSLEELAMDPSNSEYENLDSAKIIEYTFSRFDTLPTGREWVLSESLVTNKDSGYFYYPNQKIYQTPANLELGKLYQIHINKQDGSPIVSSYSEVIEPRDGSGTLLKPQGVNLQIRGLTLSSKGEEPLEDDIIMEFDMPINGKVMEVYIDFMYRDQYLDNTFSEVKTLSYKVGSFVTPKIKVVPSENVRVEGRLNATSFYTFIAGNVPVVEDGSNIRQRVILDVPLKFRYINGGQELQTYMEVSTPSTSLLENKPEYTNIENGIGVFSCRSFEEMDGYLSRNSITYLVDGEICAGRRFCHTTSNVHPLYCY